MIRTSKHSIRFSNINKTADLNSFITEYRRVAKIIVDEVWDNGYDNFSIQNNQLTFPKFLDYNTFDIDTNLTGRALSSLVTQISGMIRAEVEKQKKRLFILEKKKNEGASKSQRKLLAKKIKQNIPIKPSCLNIQPELSSKCVDWRYDENGYYDGFLQLKSIVTSGRRIRLPIKLFTKHTKKLIDKGGEMMNSFLIGTEFINVRWKLPTAENKKGKETIGADQGLKDVVTLSDGQQAGKVDRHGYSLETILKKMSLKKKGSHAFKRCQNQRKNFINWSINQLNLSSACQLNLEKIFNIGYKSNQSRYMSHWTNTIIRDKIEKKCEEEGVRLTHQSSTYRSQRCSCCGNVRKANRKGKIYSCKHCGNIMDADLNAAKNHEFELPEIPYVLRKKNLNRGFGFFWKPSGFFDFSGRSLESLPHVELTT